MEASSSTELLRVAVTLEQCWHRVPGGTATSTLGAVDALARRGDLELVGVAARHRADPPEPFVPPVPVGHLGLPRPLLYESWHRRRRPHVERATGEVDLIHATTFAVPPPTVPLVVTVHDLAFLHEPDHFTRRGLRLFHRGLELAIRDATLVTCPSDETRRDCERHGFDPDRLRVVPWGVASRPATSDEVARTRRRHGLERPYVLWVGTIEPRKNLPVLLEAVDRLGREDLDVVLVGPEGWHESLRDRPGPTPRRVLGFVPDEELRALYAGAAVFCYPSLREGFGLPVLEAMAQGVPVVTSAGTATAEVAGEAGILVDPTDPTEVATALQAVLEDEAEAAWRGAAGQLRARSYTWRRTADLLAASYREAVG